MYMSVFRWHGGVIVALSTHSKKVQIQVLQFSPTVQRLGVRLTHDSKLSIDVNAYLSICGSRTIDE